jgi:D-amino-acid oxidase
MQRVNAVVVGCGISGLTCGVRLLEEGFQVTILAKLIPPNTTSDKAGAIWYPYRAYPEDKVLPWCKKTFDKFLKLSELTEAGVSFTELHDVFGCEVSDPWWKEAVNEFRRLQPTELPQGYVDGYAAKVPLIETPLYMPYLVNCFNELGGKIEILQERLTTLSELYADNPLIINCTGLGARKLVNDFAVFPVRGQVIRTKNPGIKRGIADETGRLALSYVIPRSKDCVLGGTAEENDWSEEVDSEISKDILHRCQQLDPMLMDLEIIDAKVGLRPGRNEIRLEAECVTDKCTVIHNYGHGGAGFTLSWGCADNVVGLAKQVVRVL